VARWLHSVTLARVTVSLLKVHSSLPFSEVPLHQSTSQNWNF
jgi:hypothetical protein